MEIKHIIIKGQNKKKTHQTQQTKLTKHHWPKIFEDYKYWLLETTNETQMSNTPDVWLGLNIDYLRPQMQLECQNTPDVLVWTKYWLLETTNEARMTKHTWLFGFDSIRRVRIGIFELFAIFFFPFKKICKYLVCTFVVTSYIKFQNSSIPTYLIFEFVSIISTYVRNQ